MNNFNFYIIVISVAIFTIMFKLAPLFIKVPENNKYLNTFFDVLPISILTILALPEAFTSIGKTKIDIFTACCSILCITFLTYKKKNLILIVFSALFIAITLKEILIYGNF
ncbi:AzlD domain-containing protein [Caviibacter abscessus]|uniref:AzlD domain-containing protein n=1 Tax=Caviibacter abscessus TaxID=1766719 RepID=UPI000829B8BF|nr:AzlD domain-containing protein [Caviibacter abscessus]